MANNQTSIIHRNFLNIIKRMQIFLGDFYLCSKKHNLNNFKLKNDFVMLQFVNLYFFSKKKLNKSENKKNFFFLLIVVK